jgi:2'-5' RNA ligase
MSLRRKDQRGVRFVAPESWHVTLRFFGEADIDEVEAALDEAVLAPATAVIGPAVDVLGERALVVPVSGLDALADEVVAVTRAIGDPPPKRAFTGHLTIARVKRDVPMPPALGAMVDGVFAVEEVELLRSRLDPEGARYDTVATWSVPSG